MKTHVSPVFFKKISGFTLLELMVAISIFAIVSLLTMGGLSNVLNTQEHTEKNLQRLTRLQMVFTIMSRELQQLSARSIRDEYGAFVAPLSNEVSGGIAGIEFTHQGRFTLGDQVSLQRVAYYLEDKQLVKKIWPVLDRVEDTKPIKQILLDEVDDLSFSFYSAQSGGSSGNNDIDWNNSVDTQGKTQLKAIRVAITTTDYDEIYRVFEIAQ